jgi:hypothetical protein
MGACSDFNLDVIACSECFDRINNPVGLLGYPGPRGTHQDNDSDCAILQVLLIAQILVRNLSLVTRHSSLRRRRFNLHPATAGSRLCAVNSSTASTCSRLTPGNHWMKSSTVAPSSRFSKSAFTGTRVPRNTKAPLTVSGEVVTPVQSDQSNMIVSYLRHPLPATPQPVFGWGLSCGSGGSFVGVSVPRALRGSVRFSVALRYQTQASAFALSNLSTTRSACPRCPRPACAALTLSTSAQRTPAPTFHTPLVTGRRRGPCH